jgi:hypothetical protein
MGSPRPFTYVTGYLTNSRLKKIATLHGLKLRNRATIDEIKNCLVIHASIGCLSILSGFELVPEKQISPKIQAIAKEEGRFCKQKKGHQKSPVKVQLCH